MLAAPDAPSVLPIPIGTDADAPTKPIGPDDPIDEESGDEETGDESAGESDEAIAALETGAGCSGIGIEGALGRTETGAGPSG